MSAWSPWPPAPPFGPDATAALWLDGSLEAALTAAWLTGTNRRWVGLVPRLNAGAEAVATRLATQAAAPWAPVEAPADFLAPTAWAGAWEVAREQGATWLVAPLASAPGEPPGALRLHAAGQALASWGLEGLWTPLWGCDELTIARWALALGVPLEASHDCLEAVRCGRCEGCAARARRLRALGLADPGAPEGRPLA